MDLLPNPAKKTASGTPVIMPLHRELRSLRIPQRITGLIVAYTSMEEPRRGTIAFYDGAVAPGGALGVLAVLFKNLKRTEFRPRLIAAAPRAQLRRYFADEDIALARRPALHYPERYRLENRVARLPRIIGKLTAYLFSAIAVIRNLPANIAILKVLLQERPLLLHVNTSATPILWAWILRIPVIWHIHGVPSYPRFIDRILMKKVDHFVAISEYVAQAAVSHGYPPDRVTVIHNPAPDPKACTPAPAALRERFGIPKDYLVIAHVGRLVRWKGQLEFLHAFKTLIERYNNVVALIVGDDAEGLGSDYIAELKQYIDKNALSRKVYFTGHIDQILDLMASVDLVVHSSIEPEPFGLVITEAMSAGTPIVASQLGAPAELIESEKTGYLIDPQNSPLFYSALNSLVESTHKRQAVANQAKLKVQQCFSANVFTKKMVKLYKMTIAGN